MQMPPPLQEKRMSKAEERHADTQLPLPPQPEGPPGKAPGGRPEAQGCAAGSQQLPGDSY